MSIRMKELPLCERPYEKLEMYGANTLSNAELLAIIIKTGTKEDTAVNLAQRILKLNENTKTQGLQFLQEISIEEFTKVKGIGRVKAIQLQAVAEIAKRMTTPTNIFKYKIKNPEDVAKLLMEEMRYEKREIAKVILLNTKNNVLKVSNISFGGTNLAIIEPKEVLSEAIKMQAPKIILIHNHPSGDPTPSEQDFIFTDKMYEACEIIGIELLDHIIIGNGCYESIFSENKKRSF